jgi:hypothetical protein
MASFTQAVGTAAVPHGRLRLNDLTSAIGLMHFFAANAVPQSKEFELLLLITHGWSFDVSLEATGVGQTAMISAGVAAHRLL